MTRELELFHSYLSWCWRNEIKTSSKNCSCIPIRVCPGQSQAVARDRRIGRWKGGNKSIDEVWAGLPSTVMDFFESGESIFHRCGTLQTVSWVLYHAWPVCCLPPGLRWLFGEVHYCTAHRHMSAQRVSPRLLLAKQTGTVGHAEHPATDQGTRRSQQIRPLEPSQHSPTLAFSPGALNPSGVKRKAIRREHGISGNGMFGLCAWRFRRGDLGFPDRRLW